MHVEFKYVLPTSENTCPGEQSLSLIGERTGFNTDTVEYYLIM